MVGKGRPPYQLREIVRLVVHAKPSRLRHPRCSMSSSTNTSTTAQILRPATPSHRTSSPPFSAASWSQQPTSPDSPPSASLSSRASAWRHARPTPSTGPGANHAISRFRSPRCSAGQGTRMHRTARGRRRGWRRSGRSGPSERCSYTWTPAGPFSPGGKMQKMAMASGLGSCR